MQKGKVIIRIHVLKFLVHVLPNSFLARAVGPVPFFVRFNPFVFYSKGDRKDFECLRVHGQK